jgi:peptide/nickel transport system permease protein
MLAYIIRRLLLGVLTVIGVMVITFSLFYLVRSPESLARQNLTAKNPTQQQIKGWLAQHGYDKPRGQQFKVFMQQLSTFNFGKSDADGEPVGDKIKRGIGPSLMIAVPSFILGLIATVTFALVLAYHRGTYLDTWGTFLCVVIMSVNYTLYIIGGQYLFGKVLRLWPIMGFASGVTGWKFVILPVLISLISGLGSTARFYRTFFLDEMYQDYVRTARAKGVSESRILFRHILKNAMIPILTTTVMVIPSLFLGSLLLETFFGVPGLGSLTMDAIDSGDFAVLRAMVYIGSWMYIIGIILTDISYTLVDPRVRVGS